MSTLLHCKLFWIVFIVFSQQISARSWFSKQRYKRQECGYQCKGGSCIEEDQLCDGIANCDDGSDETETCKELITNCPGYLFQCKYGACIPQSKVCDGKKDCVDNSDETVRPNCGFSSTVAHSPISQLPKGDCKPEQFKCNSGECISSDFVCDGQAQCPDNSDESRTICSSIFCPGFSFTCGYGACVPITAKCNGIRDCLDGSDEEPFICGNITITTSTTTLKPVVPATKPPPGSCLTPPFPVNGNWTLVGQGTFFQSNQAAQQGAVILFTCKKGFLPNGKITLYSICDNENWSVPNVECLPVCEELSSTATTTVECSLNGQKIACNEAVENSIATFKCKQYYEDRSASAKVRYCIDGSWDKPKPECEPVCGLKNAKARPLVVNGVDAKVGDYPWHVALYKKQKNEYVYKCGGSLINQKAIITAAHCITKLDHGAPYDPKDYVVGVGKYYRNYNDSRDTEAQYSGIEKFLIPREYRGQAQNFGGDLAILITIKTFQLSDRVQSVCLDRDKSFHLSASLTGTIIGWGYTVPGQKSNADNIKELQVPYLDENECQNNLPQTFADKYYLYDKLCSGYKNKSVAVCEGDSGGGLVFPNPRHSGRFYLKGIVSVSPLSEGSCDIQEYALYTHVNEYMTFILRNTLKYEKLINEAN